MARGNGQEEVPVFSASGTVGMLSPCTALCTYFSTAYFVSSFLLSEIGDRVQGQGYFFIQFCDIENFGDCFFSQNKSKTNYSNLQLKKIKFNIFSIFLSQKMTKFGGKKYILVEFTSIHPSIHPSLGVTFKLEGQKWPYNFFSVNIFALNLPVNSVSSTLCARLCLMGGNIYSFIYLFQ